MYYDDILGIHCSLILTTTVSVDSTQLHIASSTEISLATVVEYGDDHSDEQLWQTTVIDLLTH